MKSNANKVVTVGLLMLTPLFAGCAGDLGAAREAAGKAASFVGDMQDTTLSAIEQQRAVQQAELARVAELQAAGQANLMMINQYRAIWQGANLKDSTDLFKTMAEMTSDADLPKSVPFVLMAPLRQFDGPAIDRKAFTELIAKFNKLEEGLSPIDRARALAPFVEVVVKSYKDSVGEAKSEPALVKSSALKAKALPTGTVLSLTVPAVSNMSPNQPEMSGHKIATGGIATSVQPLEAQPAMSSPAMTAIDTVDNETAPMEALSDNAVPIDGLLNALGSQ